MADPPRPVRFRPRAGIQRISQAERDRIRQAQEARDQQRLAEASQASGSTSANRGGLGRGRGGAVVHHTQRIRIEDSGGVFGAALPSTTRPKGGRQASTVSGTSEIVGVEGNGVKAATAETPGGKIEDTAAEVKTKKQTSTRANKTTARDEEVFNISSDEANDAGPARDIEMIWISSDEEDEEPIKRKAKQPPNRPQWSAMGLRPVRAPRDPHEQDGIPSTKMATTAPKGGFGLDHDSTTIIDGEMDIDNVTADDLSPSMERKRVPSKKKGSRPKVDSSISKETVEERAERLRYQEDVEKIRQELSNDISISIDKMDDIPGDTSSLGQDDEQRTPNGRVYLFQFPPLVPFLHEHSRERIEIKEEDDLSGDALIAVREGISNAALASSSSAAAIKKEDGATDEASTANTGGNVSRPKILTADGTRLPSGLAGKLVVHKSGKVALHWGDAANMELRWGTEVDHLQDVVLVTGGDGGGGGGGTAHALGQVRKKLVVIPDWQALYD